MVPLYSDIEGQNIKDFGPERNPILKKTMHIWNMVQTSSWVHFVCACVFFWDCLPPGSDELAGQFITTMHLRVNGPLDLHTSLLLFDTSLILVLGPRLLLGLVYGRYYKTWYWYKEIVYQCWADII
jgi:hypothetical protein